MTKVKILFEVWGAVVSQTNSWFDTVYPAVLFFALHLSEINPNFSYYEFNRYICNVMVNTFGRDVHIAKVFFATFWKSGQFLTARVGNKALRLFCDYVVVGGLLLILYFISNRCGVRIVSFLQRLSRTSRRSYEIDSTLSCLLTKDIVRGHDRFLCV